uniref:Uncharacterized protein n=1 Tax=Promethearchaeum syntrophicum TaxID=2594042 RepID=A0A5B9DGB6_9ARCH|nr:hypothetical protein [Candidatus Prometheoarchaeum syntrophicum]QEE17717.1 hypothetical protein DSAG12_03555 [Candidatus Prometheoarchaeum syntrophicum]
MRQKGKKIFVGMILVVLITASKNFLDLGNTENIKTTQPESAALVSDLGVRVGDALFYRVFDRDTIIYDEGLPQGEVLKYEILSMAGEDLRYNANYFDSSGIPSWGYPDRTNNFGTYQVFDPNWLTSQNWQISMVQLTTITDYAAANGTTVEDLDQAWRNKINSNTEPISTAYDSSSNADFHLLSFVGYEDDNPSYYRELEVWIDKITGIVTVLNETDELGRLRYQELMGYEKGPDSILPDWTYPNPSNYHIGDWLVRYSPTMDGNFHADSPVTIDWDNEIDEIPGFGFFKHTIKFMYRNPETLEDVVVVKIQEYENTYVDSITPFSPYLYKEEGRTIENDPDSECGVWLNYSKIIGFDILFFDQDMIPTIDLNEFGYKVACTMVLVPGYSVVQEENSIKVNGIDIHGRNAEFYMEGLDGYGFPEVQWMKYWNETDTEWNLEMTIQGPGVVESHPNIGVDEAVYIEGETDVGDQWRTVSQTRLNSHNWDSSLPDEWKNESRLVTKRYSVTHIFALNASVMAVFGRLSARRFPNNPFGAGGNPFAPFLIYDTNDPSSFLTYGGFAAGTDDPPAILPIVSDWTDYGPQLETRLESDLSIGASVIRSHFTPNTIRLVWDEEENNSPEWKNNSGQIMLESNAAGIVSHLEFEQNLAWDDGFGKGEEIKEDISSFHISYIPIGSQVYDYYDHYTGSDVTSLDSGDVLIWENQRYQPDETEIYEHDRNKFIIRDIISTLDGSIAIFGERFRRDFSDTVYHGEYWVLERGQVNLSGGEPLPLDVNYWMLSSVREKDIWSWMQGQIFDKDINDFDDYATDLVEMLNFALSLPAGVSISASDITIDSNWFEISVFNAEKDVDHIIKFAVNQKGILQDLLIGEKDPVSGDWLNYERSVLAAGPGDIGEFFSDTLPMYVTADLSEDTLDIPGSLLLIISIIAFASIVVVIRKMKK